MSEIDKMFAGSIPRIYESYLVPLLFQPYAADLVDRLKARNPSRVLEIAAGTGVVTRVMSDQLDPQASIVATDLNPDMIKQAEAIGTSRKVEWRQADAMQLPFPDGGFDAVVCQFGVMFFPDKAKAFSEMHRVLNPGGVLMFNVWDRLEENEIAETITESLAGIYPDDPPRFLPRTPYGYHDPAIISQHLTSGGFARKAQIATVTARSKADSAETAAIAFCHGTPLRSEIDPRGAGSLETGTRAASVGLARRFGSKAVDAKIQAHVVTVER